MSFSPEKSACKCSFESYHFQSGVDGKFLKKFFIMFVKNHLYFHSSHFSWFNDLETLLGMPAMVTEYITNCSPPCDILSIDCLVSSILCSPFLASTSCSSNKDQLKPCFLRRSLTIPVLLSPFPEIL